LGYLCFMAKDIPQHQEVLAEVAILKEFFQTTPILFKTWKNGCINVSDIQEFIRLELNSAATFNPNHYFNPPLQRLQALEKDVRNQLTTIPPSQS
jgi:hypothetical protein